MVKHVLFSLYRWLARYLNRNPWKLRPAQVEVGNHRGKNSCWHVSIPHIQLDISTWTNPKTWILAPMWAMHRRDRYNQNMFILKISPMHRPPRPEEAFRSTYDPPKCLKTGWESMSPASSQYRCTWKRHVMQQMTSPPVYTGVAITWLLQSHDVTHFRFAATFDTPL